MFADLGFPMTLDYVRNARTFNILSAVKDWLERENPICLMHPHGFFVALLGQSDTEEWRFHFWPKGSRPVSGMHAFIHTHDRHVDSRVLQGELTNIIYDATVTSTDGHPLYEVNYDGDRYASATSNSLRKSGARVQTKIRSRRTIKSGHTYHVERHDYHEAVISEQFSTATIVCMHGRSPGPVLVIGTDGCLETITFNRAEHRARAFVGQILPS